MSDATTDGEQEPAPEPAVEDGGGPAIESPAGGDEPTAADAVEPTAAEADADAVEPTVVESDSDASVDASLQEPSRSGVTMPVAVPVTVALVLGLAIGLILGWLLPRPGGDSDAASGSGDTADDTVVAGGDTAGGDGPTTEGGTSQQQALSPATPTPVPGGPEGTEQFAGLVIGEEGSLVEVFEDYVCPFCARLELNAGADLRGAALAGEYRLVLHPIAFLTEDSPRAANASACSYEHDDYETWVAMHEGIYGRSNPDESVGQYSTDILLDLAGEVGASAETSTCIGDETYVPWVEDITEQAFARGVRGTPTLTVDGAITDVAPLVQ